jgi:hypothetical protein
MCSVVEVIRKGSTKANGFPLSKLLRKGPESILLVTSQIRYPGWASPNAINVRGEEYPSGKIANSEGFRSFLVTSTTQETKKKKKEKPSLNYEEPLGLGKSAFRQGVLILGRYLNMRTF